MSVRLMTEPSFPFPLMGLVHVRNRIEQRRPLRLGERPTIRVRADALERAERGTSFDLVAEATVAGKPVWSSRSTYLHRERSASGAGSPREERTDPPRPEAVWRVPGDIGRRYAAVSGDVNPIHMHSLTARAFGLPRAIAHGMWLKARCLAALEDLVPGAHAVDVRFKLPVLLPSELAFASWREGEARALAVHGRRDGKPHLSGLVEPLAEADR